jgi:hypothetical protein
MNVGGRGLGLIDVIPSQHLSGGTEENHGILRLVGDRAEIRTGNLQDINIKNFTAASTWPAAERIMGQISVSFS